MARSIAWRACGGGAVLAGWLALVLAGCGTTGGSGIDGAECDGSFASVRGVLEERCLPCHWSAQLPGMVDLTTREAAVRTRALDTGDPMRSAVITVVQAADTDPRAMPPTGHALDPSEQAVLAAWLGAGAPWPAGEAGRLGRSFVESEPRSR